MIGSLRGRLASKTPPQLTVDVGGVGYELEAPMSTFYRLPAVGEEVRLLTHLVVREDAHVLYGFATEEERRAVPQPDQGLGRGAEDRAGASLGHQRRGVRRSACRSEDVAALTRVPGVGRKTAERLIIEMRDRLAAPQPAAGAAAAARRAASPAGEAYRRAGRARVQPGGGHAAAQGAPAPAAHSTEELIRRALQGAARE